MSGDNNIVNTSNPDLLLEDEKHQFVGPKGSEDSVLRVVYTYKYKKTGQKIIIDYVDFSKLPKGYQPIGEEKEYKGKNNPESHTVTQFKYLDKVSGKEVSSEPVVDEYSDNVSSGNVKNRRCHIKYNGEASNPRKVAEKTYSYVIDGTQEEGKYKVTDYNFNKIPQHAPESEIQNFGNDGNDVVKVSRPPLPKVKALDNETTDTGITKEIFDRIMKEETYDCKNSVLLRNIMDTGSLDRGLPAKAAVSLGKCLQGLMKLRKEDTLSKKTLTDGIEAIDKFDFANNDALYHCRENTLKILSATWKNGEQIAECIGVSKEGYQHFCRGMNQEFVKNSYSKSVNSVNR